MRIILVTILLALNCNLGLAQDRYISLPNGMLDEKLEIFEHGSFYQKQKYFYDNENKIEKIEKRNPFDIVLTTDKYFYDKNCKLKQIVRLNTFNSPIEKIEYLYDSTEYSATIYDKTNQLTEIKRFDSIDRMIEHITFKDYIPSYKYEYKYSSAESKDYELFIFSPTGDKDQIESHKFDLTGNEIEIIVYNKERKVISKEILVFNQFLKIESILKTDSNNEVDETIEFKYNSDKQILSKVLRGKGGRFREQTLYFYNEAKLLSKEVYYDTEILDDRPKLNSETRYKYDKKGNLIEVKEYNTLSSKLKIQKIEMYDDQLRLLKDEEYYLGRLSKVSTYKQGLEKTQVRYNEKGGIFDITNYKYDSKGNLILVFVTEANKTLKERFGYSYDMEGHATMVDLK